MYTHMLTHTHMYTHMYTHIYTHMYTHVHTQTNIHKKTNAITKKPHPLLFLLSSQHINAHHCKSHIPMHFNILIPCIHITVTYVQVADRTTQMGGLRGDFEGKRRSAAESFYKSEAAVAKVRIINE